MSNGSRLLRWCSRTLLVIGIGALTWCAFVIGDAYVTQSAARSTLAALARSSPVASNRSVVASHPPDQAESDVPVASPDSNPRAARATGSALPRANRQPFDRMSAGTPLGLLTIPSLSLSTVVFQGTDTSTLRVGVGHVEHTAWPGERGNVAIAGHRDSFFRPLRNIQRGDDILLETPAVQIHYKVKLFEVVAADDVSVLAATADDTLTLVTCFPFSFLGSAPDRFIVKAVRVTP